MICMPPLARPERLRGAQIRRFRALAEENVTASPDVVDHVNHAWLCACGHICSGDSRTIFGMTERVRLPERPDLHASAGDLPDSSRSTERGLGKRSARLPASLRVILRPT